MKILVTGSCGFIGFNLSLFLLKKGYKIFGIDNMNDYYDVKIKYERLRILKKFKSFKFFKIHLENEKKVERIFKFKFDSVIHLAAQAGVRYSIENPKKYISSNIVGFFNILNFCRLKKIKKILYASSSSVYGDKKKFPLKEFEQINPKNIYGLTKKNNEETAEIFKNFYNLNLIGLRFFTVYGEYGRPDMFMMKYLNSKKNFNLYNYGKHIRDFTYISDVNHIIYRLLKLKNQGHLVLNICSNNPVSITKIISEINKHINKKSLRINKIKLQKADVIKTHGDNSRVKKLAKFKKFTPIEKGIENLTNWYKKN